MHRTNLSEKLRLLKRVHNLIKTKATGPPNALSLRLELSPRTVYRLIDQLRQMNAPISYDKCRRTYYYRYEITFEDLVREI